MKLYYFETPNNWKACATAKHVAAPVTFIRLYPGKGDLKSAEFLAVNPNAKAPALEDGALTLWESNAIMAHLARKAGSPLWPDAEDMVELIRWLCWDGAHFSRHAGGLVFENVIKPGFGLGEPNPAAIEESLGFFRRFAQVLDDRLAGDPFVLGERMTIADFSLACTLPYAETAGIPYREFDNIARWYDAIATLPAWASPFPRS